MDTKLYKQVVADLKATQKELLELKKQHGAVIVQNHELALANYALQNKIDELQNTIRSS